MKRALAEFEVEGIKQLFHSTKKMMENEDFIFKITMIQNNWKSP